MSAYERGNKRMDGSMMMICVGLDKGKQRSMCYSNSINMEKSEEDGEGW